MLMMKHITIYENNRLTADAISRLLADKPEYTLDRVSGTCLEKRELFENTDVLVYCNKDRSNNFISTLYKVHHRYPHIRFVLITDFIYKQMLQRIFKSGTCAVISYRSQAEDLYLAVESALDENRFMSEDIGQMVVNNTFKAPINQLSSREIEITYMLANGMNIKRVSSVLNISPKTVSTYRCRIFNKLDISGNVELVRLINQEASYLLAS